MTEAELREAAEAIEAEKARDLAACPHPELPTPLVKRTWAGKWHNTRAIDNVSYGHLELGTARFASRAEMRVALEDHRRLNLLGSPGLVSR